MSTATLNLSPEQRAEQELERICGDHVYDPHGWVYFAFDWVKSGRKPRKWQDSLLADMSKQLQKGAPIPKVARRALRYAVRSGHGPGKSALISWIILWAMSCHQDMSGIVTAGTESQLLNKTWRELSVWLDRCITKHWFKKTGTALFHVSNPSVWRVTAEAWNAAKSDTFQGLHSESFVLIIYDEASSIDPLIWEASQGGLTDGDALWLAFGNPVYNSGPFYDCFNKHSNLWNCVQVNCLDVEGLAQAEIQSWIDAYGMDSDYVRVRVLGEFPIKGFASLISAQTVADAMKRTIPIDEVHYHPVIMGVDCAHMGDDKSAIVVRKGPKTLLYKTFMGIKAPQLVDIIASYIDEYRPDMTFIDMGNIGAAVVDYLVDALKYDNIDGIHFQGESSDPACLNKRAEMWKKMSEWILTADIPDIPLLSDEFTMPSYHFENRNSLMQLEKKTDTKKRLGHSPDGADAFALTFAHPVNARSMSGVESSGRQSTVCANYERY